MHRDDTSQYLLFIEPPLSAKSKTPVEDGWVQWLDGQLAAAKRGVSKYADPQDDGRGRQSFVEGLVYKGCHFAADATPSQNFDLLLPCGLITNSLAPYYLRWFRSEVPENDWNKMRKARGISGRDDHPRPSDRREWAWMHKDDDLVTGPFKSRAEALNDAQNSIIVPCAIRVGTVEWPDPAEYVDSDLDFILDNLNDQALDEFPWADDGVFEACEGAAWALEEALKEWARGYLKPTAWTLAEDYEELTVTPLEDPHD